MRFCPILRQCTKIICPFLSSQFIGISNLSVTYESICFAIRYRMDGELQPIEVSRWASWISLVTLWRNVLAHCCFKNKIVVCHVMKVAWKTKKTRMIKQSPKTAFTWKDQTWLKIFYLQSQTKYSPPYYMSPIEIGLLWDKITYLKSHSKAFGSL